MSRYNTKVTIYSEYLLEQINILASWGGGSYTFKEMAYAVCLKPTGNLRKRLRTLEKLGVLTITYGEGENGGVCLKYTINKQPKNEGKDKPF